MRLPPRRTPAPVALGPGGLAAFASRHAPGWSMASRREPWHKLLIVLAGGGRLVVAGTARPLAEDSLLLVPAGTEHRLEDPPGRPAMVAGLCVDPVRLEAACGPAWPELLRRLRAGVRSDRQMREAALRLVGALVPARSGGLDAWGALLQLLASALRARSCAAPEGPGGVAATLAWLDEHVTQPLSVGELAARAGLSYRAFTAQVRRRTGESVLSRIVRLRLARAEALIASGMPVTNAALASGFGDLSGFYRHRRLRRSDQGRASG